jgi:hypothetical protein
VPQKKESLLIIMMTKLMKISHKMMAMTEYLKALFLTVEKKLNLMNITLKKKRDMKLKDLIFSKIVLS